MDGGTIGSIGGIAGGVLGTLGGVVGTYFSIRNTRSPEERRFVVKWAVTCWIWVSLYLTILFLTPGYLQWIPTVVYAVTMPWIVIWANRKQQGIRRRALDRSS